MLVIAVGDTHFSSNNGDDTTVMHKSIIKKIRELDPEFVVILGDVYDRHSEVNIFALSRGSDFLFELMNICTTYVLVGNHDMLNNSQFFPKEHSLCPYKRYKKLIVVDETIKHTIGDKTFVFVPYVPPGRFIEALNYVEEWDKADVIFAHQEIRGANFTTSEKSTSGDVWLESNPLLISGHLHIRQLVAKNIYYPGSPRQVKINDDEERFICKLEVEDKVSIKKIKIDSIVKRSEYIKASDIRSYEPEEGVKLKITIIGGQDDHERLAKYDYIIRDWRKRGIKVVTDIRAKKKVNEDINNVRRSYREVVMNKIAGDDNAVKIYKEIIDEI